MDSAIIGVVKRELMDILVCPVCKGKLVLKVDEEKDAEIVAGSLYCERDGVRYTIADTIPNLLPPEPPGGPCQSGR